MSGIVVVMVTLAKKNDSVTVQRVYRRALSDRIHAINYDKEQ